MFPSCHADPSTVNDSSPKATVGGFYIFSADGGGTAPSGLYRYMQAEDADWADGDVLNAANSTLTEATNDRSGGSAINANAAVGVAVGEVTDAYYGYILVWGVHTAVKTDGSVAAGDFLVPHTTDGTADTMADGEEEQVFGFALTADVSANTAPAVVRCF